MYTSTCVNKYCLFVCVCQIKLGKGRKISVVTVPSVTRWQDVVLGRMKWATITIDKQVRLETQTARKLL